MNDLSQAASNLNWLISDFVNQVPTVFHAVVLTTDGFCLAKSDGISRERANQLAAIASGITSLTQGAASLFDAGAVLQTLIQMREGFLFVFSISDGSLLAVLAAPDCDMGQIAFEMTTLVDRCGEWLTPDLRAQLQGAMK